MEKVVFTIVARNYLPFALNLMESVSLNEPEVKCVIFIADEDSSSIENLRSDLFFKGNPFKFNVDVLSAESLNIPDFKNMAFYYDVVEFCTSIKPYCMLYLFDAGYSKVVFIDPDMMCFGDLSEVWQQLEDSSVLLTPHILSSKPGGFLDEISFLNNGTWNLGFFAIKDSPDSRAVLDWWCQKLIKGSFLDYSQGLATDQKWANLMPSLFSSVCIFKEPGYDVAFWNLHERLPEKVDGKWSVMGGKHLKLFHFSGYNIDTPDSITRGLPDKVDIREGYSPLFLMYYEKIVSFRRMDTSSHVYRYNYFSNGFPIVPIHRKVFFQLLESGYHYSDPFSAEGSDSFFSYLKSKGLIGRKTVVKKNDPRLGSGVNQSRSDISNSSLTFSLLGTFSKLFFRLLGVNRAYFFTRSINWLTRPNILAKFIISKRRGSR